MAKSVRTRQARRNGFVSAAAQTVAHDLSQQFGKLLGAYVAPTSFCFNPAIGYWSHNHQDVQRISGHFTAGETKYSFGSWDHTLTSLARSGCHVIDERGNSLGYTDFTLEKGRSPDGDRDDSDEWCSLAQLEEILQREGIVKGEATP